METFNLRIIPCSLEFNEKLVKGKEAFEQAFGIKAADGYMDFPGAMQYSLELLKRGQPEEWGSYMVIHRKKNVLIGIAGYKGIPADGSVEIGYSVAPEYRLKGFATEAVQALIQNAFKSPSVKKVVAHTLPEYNASNRVLTKCGMKFIEEIYSEEDGFIWKWEIEKSMDQNNKSELNDNGKI